MFGRRSSVGLHQAIEAKEGVRIEKERQTLATITFQNYFRMYHKLAGMTGTAKSEEAELTQIYNLPVVVVPTDRPMIREDLPDLVYKQEKAKIQAVADELEEWYKQRRPVLVGTRSIEKSEGLSALLRRRGVPHQVLNAKYHEKEAEIIAQAGRPGAITIATNMAGRGVDIILGGNPPNPEDAERVRGLGGLHIIGTERHEARRIDHQLRGRAGRQGDPGSSRFYVALLEEVRGFAPLPAELSEGALRALDAAEIKERILTAALAAYEAKVASVGSEMMREVERLILLQTLDRKWIDHLYAMDALREGIGLRAYGQANPPIEYQKEGYALFDQLKHDVLEETVRFLYIVQVQPAAPMPLPQTRPAYRVTRQEGDGDHPRGATAAAAVQVRAAKVGRNDPCPCGSGKKYKKCHGRDE